MSRCKGDSALSLEKTLFFLFSFLQKQQYLCSGNIYINIYMLSLEKVEWWLPGAREREEREVLFNGYGVSVGEDEEVLEMDDGDCCTIL